MIGNIRNCAAFIAGSSRSGTTLMTALLDDHPDLLVFPEEYLYVQPREKPGERTQDVLAALFKAKILLRLQGKTSFLDELHAEHRNYDGLDYQRFKDAVNECFRVSMDEKEEWARTSVEARALISLIYGYSRAMGNEGYSRWVLKHPHYELYWKRLFSDFPDARLIYMVRDPRDVILSRTLKRNKKRYLKRGGNATTYKSQKGSLRPSVRFLKEWEQSVIASRRISEAFPGQILKVRYNDLVSDPRDVMRGVSGFLGVSWQESLVTPSFLGNPWQGNSMQERTFHGVSSSEEKYRHEFPPHYLWQIEAWLGDLMVRQPEMYIPSELSTGFNMRALLSWLRGERFMDFLRNRRRMLINQRNRTQSSSKMDSI